MSVSDPYQFDRAQDKTELRCMLSKAIAEIDCEFQNPGNAAHAEECMRTYKEGVEKPVVEGGCGVNLDSS